MTFWKGLGAAFLFLVFVGIGAFGGCTVGVFTGLSRYGGSIPNGLVTTCVSVGVVIGGAAGFAIARSYLRK